LTALALEKPYSRFIEGQQDWFQTPVWGSEVMLLLLSGEKEDRQRGQRASSNHFAYERSGKKCGHARLPAPALQRELIAARDEAAQ
jgi:hypothetical protein